jgi:gas vesicle protein
MAKLPIYELFIDDDINSGVSMVSLVDKPAIEVAWIALNEQKQVKFQTLSEEKRIIFGALLIPDKEIYRRDEKTGEEFYVKFTKDGIYNIRERFMKNRYTNNTNAQHNESILFDDVYMVETYLKDANNGINPPEQFKDLPDGTWFGGFKVDNDQVWNEYIKTGIFTGFSIEGNFKMKKLELNKTKMSNFKEGLNNLITQFFGEDSTEDTSDEIKLVEATLADGTIIKIEPALEVGATILVVTEEGDIAAPDATHELSDGTKVTTIAGIISEIELPEESVEPTIEEQLEPLLKAVTENFKSQLESIKESIKNVTEENESLKVSFSKVKDENKDLSESLKLFLAELKALPVDSKPISAVKTSTVKLTQRERAIQMAETLKSLKN